MKRRSSGAVDRLRKSEARRNGGGRKIERVGRRSFDARHSDDAFRQDGGAGLPDQATRAVAALAAAAVIRRSVLRGVGRVMLAYCLMHVASRGGPHRGLGARASLRAGHEKGEHESAHGGDRGNRAPLVTLVPRV